MKKFKKDTIALATTGIGLGLLGSIDSTGTTGMLAKGVGTASGIVMTGHAIRFLGKATKQSKNKLYKI